jgi:hypothetical protein
VPGSQHEALIELFRLNPELAPQTLGEVFGIAVPPHTRARLECGDLTEWAPTEYRSDVTVVLESPGPVLSVIVEVQRTRDIKKRKSWPVYLTTLRGRLDCDTVLLVVCPDKGVARWCAQPIRIGHPGFTLEPLVCGPEEIPMITDPAVAVRDLHLTTLSAITHGDKPEGRSVLKTFAEVLRSIDPQHQHRYYDLVFVALSEAARTYLEGLMTSRLMSDFARRHYSQGEADALLAVLKVRGFVVSDGDREMIENCRDADQLRIWVERAVTAASTKEIFA